MGYFVTPSFLFTKSRKWLNLLVLTAFILSQCFFPVLFPSYALAWGEFTYKDEQELGRKFSILIKSRMPLVEDPEVTRYIGNIVSRLSAGVSSKRFPFTVSVLRDPSLNAFATPGGYLFVNTGLILSMEHESEIAAVLGHEMAHVTQRHIAKRIESSQMISLLSILGALTGALVGGDVGAAAMTGSLAAGQATMLKHSREDEGEADQVGMNYLKKAGYNTAGFVSAFQKMGKKQWTLGSALPVYLSTHPNIQERIKSMSARIGIFPGKPIVWDKEKENDTKFFRMQTLVRARYSDPAGATVFFNKQLKGENRSMALLGLGIVASSQNRIKDAASYFEKALVESPSDELIIREVGRFHYLKGDKKRGRELLKKAVHLDRNDLMALYFYARGLADAGNTTEALSYMKKILVAIPEDVEIHYLMGQYYGAEENLFQANLHMAYSYLYSNVPNKVEQFLKKAKSLATTQKQKDQISRFDREYKERKEFWS